MKKINYVSVITIICLLLVNSISVFADDGDTPIANLTGDTPVGNIVGYLYDAFGNVIGYIFG